MRTAALIYPHQLFNPHPARNGAAVVFLVEDPLFFRQYPFHRQKLMLHRASMKRYVQDTIPTAKYINAHQLTDTADIVKIVQQAGCDTIRVVDPNDDWLTRKLTAACTANQVVLNVITDPHFLTSQHDIDQFVAKKSKLFFTDFYIQQRKRLGILLTPDQKPVGGKWSFDTENRKRLPKTVTPPAPPAMPETAFVREARAYTRAQFPNAIGSDVDFAYPTSATEARVWLDDFLRNRLTDFGSYEDAISTSGSVLFHSVLTPTLNTGLLSPGEVLEATLRIADQIPINSLEGFIRQIIGWREFIRLVYRTHGRRQRTRNYWKQTRPIPDAFYTGTTGIDPVDHTIRTALKTGYCHHIERLMVLGNFMLLCDLHPDAVYQWFMEFFIDAYDWVMVPNVYGMSQHADGGLMTTKPYISGSSYILKMSNYKRGPWCEIWDALYWRFIDRHANFFKANPRMAVMVGMLDKLGPKLAHHHQVAEQFLTKLK